MMDWNKFFDRFDNSTLLALFATIGLTVAAVATRDKEYLSPLALIWILWFFFRD